MKSSTLRRSNLSKERMLVLEELSRNKKQPYDASPGVYVRANKEKELDVLWQNFKVSQKEDKSPGIYLATGFIAGAIVMLIMTTLLSFSVHSTDSLDAISVPKTREKAKLTFIPADKSANNGESVKGIEKVESYTVKEGDTLQGIVIRFYGKYSPANAEKIRAANNMANPNALKIGQTLTIPVQ